MKKLMIAVAIVCTMFTFPACGKNADNKTENNVNLTNNDVTTAQTEVTDEVPDETTSLPDRSTLEKIPDEAVDSFNQVVDVCKEIYPLAEKTKRLYGYTGTKTVNKKNCYIFVIYDKNDDVLTLPRSHQISFTFLMMKQEVLKKSIPRMLKLNLQSHGQIK